MSHGKDSEKPQAVVPQIFCRLCASPLVQAADWSQEEGSRWMVRLWCPECGFERIALLDRAQVTYLSLAVEDGFARLLESLAELNDLSPTDVCPYTVRRLGPDRTESAGE